MRVHLPRRRPRDDRRDQLLPLNLRRLQFGLQRITDTQQLSDAGNNAPLFSERRNRHRLLGILSKEALRTVAPIPFAENWPR